MERFEQSQEHLERALELQRHILRLERKSCSRAQLRARLLEVADTLTNLGGLGLEWLGMSDAPTELRHRSLQHLDEALEIRATVLGQEDGRVDQVRQIRELVSEASSMDKSISLELSVTQDIHMDNTPTFFPETPTRKATNSVSFVDSVERKSPFQGRISPERSPDLRKVSSSSSTSPSRSSPYVSPVRRRAQVPNLPAVAAEAVYRDIDAVTPEKLTRPSVKRPTPIPVSLPTLRSPPKVKKQQPSAAPVPIPARQQQPVPVPVPVQQKEQQQLAQPQQQQLETDLYPPPVLDEVREIFQSRLPTPERIPTTNVETNTATNDVRSTTSSLAAIGGSPAVSLVEAPRPMSRTPPRPEAEPAHRVTPVPRNAPPITEIHLDGNNNNDLNDSSTQDDSTDPSLSSFVTAKNELHPGTTTVTKVYMASPTILSGLGCGDAQLSMKDEAEESCVLDDSLERDGLVHRIRMTNNDTANKKTDDHGKVPTSSAHEIVLVRPEVDSLFSSNTTWTSLDNATDDNDSKTKTKVISPDDGVAPLSDNPELDDVAPLQRLAARHLKLNNNTEALQIFQEILARVKARHGELHHDVGAALHNAGLASLRMENLDQALLYLERAVRVRKGSLGRDHPDVAVSMVKVGVTLLLQQRFDAALQAFHDALSVRKRALGALHLATARIYNNIGCVHVEFGEVREARRAFEAALDIQRNALYHQPDHQGVMFGAATTLSNLGYLYRSRGMHHNAAIVLKETLQLQRELLGKEHPTVLSTMDAVADALSVCGICVDALQMYKELLRYMDTTTQSRGRAVLLYKASQVHRQQRDYQSELARLEEALTCTQTLERQNREALERAIKESIQRARKQVQNAEYDWI